MGRWLITAVALIVLLVIAVLSVATLVRTHRGAERPLRARDWDWDRFEDGFREHVRRVDEQARDGRR